MARQKQYASSAERQKAYRGRKRNEKVVTKSCPYCQSDVFFDVTGKASSFAMFESSYPAGRVFFCVNCNAYITIDDQSRPLMWHIIVRRPNLASV